MRAILICPDERPALARLAGVAPLANLPILGQGLAEYWLEHLAVLGAKEVLVLAADRPHEVRARVERGARWGLRVEVIPETRELTVAEAREKYRQGQTGGWLPEPNDVVLLDRLPGLPEQPLLTGYSDFFAAVSAWFSRTASPLRVGMHELQPGIRAGLRTHVAPSARLHPPCWLGDQVWIGPDAEIGPMAVLEDRVFVEGGSTISHSLVGPETFVGRLTDLRDSIAWGRRLMNWRTGSSFEVNEPFLLCALHERHASSERWSWLARLAALGLMVVTLPAGAWVMWRSYLRGKPLLRRKVAICPQDGAELHLDNTLTYYELASANRWLRRWPQLWNVLRGEFSWVGNRPLSPADAAELSEHFERLWLTAPMGLISLADALGCPQAFNDEARAHASFYAVQANWKTDARIFARVLIASLLGVQPRERTAGLPVPFPSEVLKGEG